jgi:hypothetical protein
MSNRWGAVYPLPDNLNPHLTLCVQLTIPNDKQYYQQLWSLINVATIWMAWDRDNAHSGAVVADTWKKIIKTLQVCQGETPTFTSDGADTEMSIRQNPENPCELQSSQDGTNWCTFVDLSKCTNFGNQTGTGTTPPPPNGGTTQYCNMLQASSKYLVPVAVSTGDTIKLDDASGAGNDPTVSGLNLTWRLPNGNQFFAGTDVGFPTTDSADPLPSTNHMQLIAGIGDTPVFLPLTVGSAVTVPSGVSNAQLWIQVNDSVLLDNHGSYSICVTVKNNQVSEGCRSGNFALTPYSFLIPNDSIGHPMAIWTGGIGFESQDTQESGSNFQRRTNTYINLPSIPVTHVNFTLNLTKGTYHDPTDLAILILVNGSPVLTVNHSAAVDGDGQIFGADVTGAVTQIDLIVSSSVEDHAVWDGSCAITAVEICYTGSVAPF